MPRPTSLADFLQDWETLLAALDQNEDDFPHLSGSRTRLADLLGEARGLLPVQAAHAAARQDTSRRLEAAVAAGRKVATVIRVTVRERYGNRNEKLTEFRMKPFRSRSVPPKLPEPEIAAPPAAPGSVE